MNYRIEYLEEVYDQFKKIPKNIRKVITKAIRERLAVAPHRFRPLAGGWRGYYRLRVGDYRVIYKIEEQRVTVVVVRVAPRGCVY